MGRTIAIGDIHGHALALEAILKAISPRKSDVVITLGDYIDRGPDSKRVVEVLFEWQSKCNLICLKGNHEIFLLDSFENPDVLTFWKQSGGDTTLQSYGGHKGIPEKHLAFFRNLKPWHETDTHIFVHANYHPQRDMEDQTDEHLYWEHLSFMIPSRHHSGKTVIVGHTPQRDGEILDHGHIVCIDTHCFGDGYLTAYDVETRYAWQVDKHGNLRRR